jgi:hypothetical protein
MFFFKFSSRRKKRIMSSPKIKNVCPDAYLYIMKHNHIYGFYKKIHGRVELHNYGTSGRCFKYIFVCDNSDEVTNSKPKTYVVNYLGSHVTPTNVWLDHDDLEEAKQLYRDYQQRKIDRHEKWIKQLEDIIEACS